MARPGPILSQDSNFQLPFADDIPIKELPCFIFGFPSFSPSIVHSSWGAPEVRLLRPADPGLGRDRGEVAGPGAARRLALLRRGAREISPKVPENPLGKPGDFTVNIGIPWDSTMKRLDVT